MKAWLKRTAYRLAPETTGEVLAARARRYNQAFVSRLGAPALNDKLVARFGAVVQSGPFAGLAFGPMARAEHLGPFLLGTYEQELHAPIDRLLTRTYSLVVDVGAKLGYYAAGFARRLPAARVAAFDTDPWARRATGETARVNGLGNVEVLGRCTPDWWGRHLPAGSLILSDCEGYEGVLFGSPGPQLATATLIVETHDFIAPGTTDRLLAAFAPTHTAEVVQSGSTAPVPPAALDLTFLTEPECGLAVNEFRAARQSWLVLTPRPAG